MRKRWLLAALCDINRLRGPGESSGGGLSLTETFVRANHLEAHVPVEVLLHRESQGVGHDATPRGLAGPQGHGPSGHAHLEVLDHISPLREPWKTEKMVLCGGLHSGGVNRGRGGEARGPYEKKGEKKGDPSFLPEQAPPWSSDFECATTTTTTATRSATTATRLGSAPGRRGRRSGGRARRSRGRGARRRRRQGSPPLPQGRHFWGLFVTTRLRG